MEEEEHGTKEGERKSSSVMTSQRGVGVSIQCERRRKRRNDMRAGHEEETPDRMPALTRNYVFKCVSI